MTNNPNQGFPSPAILEARHYKCVTLSQQGEDKQLSCSGTNGFIGNIDAYGTSDM